MTRSRATLMATADEPANRDAAIAWIEQHHDALGFVSDNLGCGCCVDIWNIEGDSAVVRQVPPSLLAASAWADGDEA